MSLFRCEYCNYETKDKSNLKKHCKTKKHNEIMNLFQKFNLSKNDNSKDSQRTPKGLPPKRTIDKELKNKGTHVCNYCNSTFTRRNNLGRHLQKCIEKKKYDEENKLKIVIKNKERVIENKDKEIKHYKEEVDHYKNEIEYYRNIINAAGTIIQKSMSSFSYINNNYNDAPKIEELKEDDIKLLEDDKQKLVEWIIYNYNHKTLDKYLGEFIVKIYKKEKPENQSIWNTDSSRLTYIIKDLIDKKSSKWKIDKKGKKTKKFLIKPLLKHLKIILSENRELLLSLLKNNNGIEIETLLDKVKTIFEVIKSIDDELLCNNILRYISPYLYFDKDSIKKIKLESKD